MARQRTASAAAAPEAALPKRPSPQRTSPPRADAPARVPDRQSPYIFVRAASWLRRHGVGSFWLPAFAFLLTTAPSPSWCLLHSVLMVRCVRARARSGGCRCGGGGALRL